MARFGRRLSCGSLLVLGLMAFTVVGVPGAEAASTAPAGFVVTDQQQLTDGVEHVRLVRSGDALVVNVARVSPDAPVELRAVLSNEDVNGGLERTSAMCRRVRCIVAVNGDFHHLATGEPVGGLVTGGNLVRSPVTSHHQLTFTPDGPVASGQLAWSGRLMASDLREIALTDVNRARAENAVVLYSPAFGRSTGTNPHGAELVLRVVGGPDLVRLGQTSLVEAVAFHDGQGDTAIPVDGLVLSGHGDGATAIRDLWSRIQSGEASSRALLRLDADTDATDSLGGSPVLVRDGAVFVGEDGSSFAAGRHPRTIVGWTSTGEILLVTIDGRQPGYSEGVPLGEAARLMVELGAVEALNLDGGGSTTFATDAGVVNRPSDRLVRRGRTDEIVHAPRAGDEVIGYVERPVSVALAVVPERGEAQAAADPLAADVALPRREYTELALGVPGSDPASDPAGDRPALVATVPREHESPTRPLLSALAGVSLFAAAAPTGRELRRRLRSGHAPS